MAKPGRQTFEKRLRERKRKEKQAEKVERKAQRKAGKEEGGGGTDDEFDFDLEMIDVEQTLALPEDHPLRIAVEKKLAADALAAEQEQNEDDDSEEEGEDSDTAEASPVASSEPTPGA